MITYQGSFKLYQQKRYALRKHKKYLDEYKVDLVTYIKRVSGVENVVSELDYTKKILDEYIKQNELVNVILSYEKQKEILVELTQLGIWNSRGNTYQQLGRLINTKDSGYKLIRHGRNENKEKKIILADDLGT